MNKPEGSERRSHRFLHNYEIAAADVNAYVERNGIFLIQDEKKQSKKKGNLATNKKT